MSTPTDPGFVPGYGQNTVSNGPPGQDNAGNNRGGDPTSEPGQYPDSLFGMPLPQGTGAPGSQGAKYSASVDPTNQPGQLEEGLTGMGPPETDSTGSPGTKGAQNRLAAGADTVTFTKLSSGIGPYQMQTVQADISGSGDWTAANEQGYASGGPQLPGIKGNEPSVNDGPFTAKSGGRVRRGGNGAS